MAIVHTKTIEMSKPKTTFKVAMVAINFKLVTRKCNGTVYC